MADLSMGDLDAIAERVDMYFAQQIAELDNGQTEYVVEQMLSIFEGHQALLQAGSR